MNSEKQSVAPLIYNWLKVTLLGHNPLCLCIMVGLEFGLVPSAFLASAAASSELAHLILPANMQPLQLSYVDEALAAWSQECEEQPPTDAGAHHQKTWDSLRVSSIADTLLANTHDKMQRARFLVASCKKSGSWLNVSPISSLGLDDDATARISMGLHLGLPLCQSHACQHCGAEVSQFATLGLSCRKSAGHHHCHSAVNNIIHRALVAAHVPSRLEPSGLYRSDGWYINCPLEVWPTSSVGCNVYKYFCTLLLHNCCNTSTCKHLDSCHFFTPVAIEATGAFGTNDN